MPEEVKGHEVSEEIGSLKSQIERLEHKLRLCRGVPKLKPRKMLEQLVLWAWQHVEISEGRACELLNIDRMAWRDLVKDTNTVQDD